ncbi:MAG: exosortase/archaeosortase family protein [Pseudomonadota bacterium]
MAKQRKRSNNSKGGFRFVARFVAIFVALQIVLVFLLGEIVQPFLIEQATVQPGAPLLAALYPADMPVAASDMIRSSTVSLQVLRGCEGTEFYLLLAAAILAFPASWRQKAAALVVGCSLVFVLNQARLVVLYAIARDHRDVFQLVHVYFAPLVFVAIIGALFSIWSGRVLPSPNRA